MKKRKAKLNLTGHLNILARLKLIKLTAGPDEIKAALESAKKYEVEAIYNLISLAILTHRNKQIQAELYELRIACRVKLQAKKK